MSADTVATHAPYWPVATLLLGVLCGVLLHHAWTVWEDRRSGR